ncbi:metallophosphoesterase family protein [Croceibacterium aestuarii]|uniref:metallophosphoesterase family protein n=1 Tax=Croceibacterium aestuarii TaxID=3064139 RepID=UPI00272EA00E|nr:metallophosphoesterase family protein [Croceibacterium sp. D39]
MLKAIRHLFGREGERPTASVPAGQRVYAVGDVHGRLDLFNALIDAIEADDASAVPADTTVVLLGDLVDRGPDSAGVVARARDWQRGRKVRILAGNHEEMFLKSFTDRDMLRHFLRFGGRETVLSYGIDRHIYNSAEIDDVQSMMNACVPQEDRDFIAGFEDMIAIGDYLFVHAGIMPDMPLEEQHSKYLRWIREPFLSHAAPHGAVIVHGHTIFDEPDDRGNRIGIDTGAYCNGRLTALVLEGDTRRYIEAVELDGAISATPRVLAA